MCAHDLIVHRANLGGTSAEPSSEAVLQAHRICNETIFGEWLGEEKIWVALNDAIAGEGDVDETPAQTTRRRENAREQSEELAREFRGHSRDAVLRAALILEQVVQAQLWDCGGPGAGISRSLARSLWDAEGQAHSAVVAKTGSRRWAKDLQEKAANGRPPLTVCSGRRLRRLPEEVLRYNAPDLLEHYGEGIVPLGSGDGCGTIILDTNEPRAPKKYCDRCAAKAGNTMNAGLAKNALARLRASRKLG